jgi:hypothetical protein
MEEPAKWVLQKEHKNQSALVKWLSNQIRKWDSYLVVDLV